MHSFLSPGQLYEVNYKNLNSDTDSVFYDDSLSGNPIYPTPPQGQFLRRV